MEIPSGLWVVAQFKDSSYKSSWEDDDFTPSGTRAAFSIQFEEDSLELDHHGGPLPFPVAECTSIGSFSCSCC